MNWASRLGRREMLCDAFRGGIVCSSRYSNWEMQGGLGGGQAKQEMVILTDGFVDDDGDVALCTSKRRQDDGEGDGDG